MDGENEFMYEDRRYGWWENNRVVKVELPEPGIFRPSPLKRYHDLGSERIFIRMGKPQPTIKPERPVDILAHYGEKGIQVIVKLANIHLTPEKPKYEGGTWHVEGQLVCFLPPQFFVLFLSINDTQPVHFLFLL
jgi:hypothetical protein